MLMLSGCFMLSAIARVADPASAFALELPRLGASGETAPAGLAAAPVVATHSDLASLLATLREREDQLDERGKKLASKARVIEAAEAKLRHQMKRLEEAELRLGELLRVADSAADKDVGKLVSAFQVMDGKRAGPIFESMDVAFAAGLLTRMDNEAAAGVLAVLSPQKAYAITAHIAGQNALAPKK